MRKPPPGLGLAEAMVAMAMLAAAALGLAGSSLLAARLSRQAEGEARVRLLAETVLDSLVHTAHPQSGEVAAQGATVSWSVSTAAAGPLIDVLVLYSDGDRRRRLRLAAIGERSTSEEGP